MADKWHGPYKVIKVVGQGTLEIKRLDQREQNKIINVAIIKPYTQPTTEQVEQPAPASPEKQKRRRKVYEKNPEFERVTRSKKPIDNLISTSEKLNIQPPLITNS